MNKNTSLSIRFGEWLLIRRWWFVALASLSILIFELIEYLPITRGADGHFLIEVIIFTVLLPVSTGLALSALAASRSELAWSVYYQDLKRNLDIQLYDAHSHVELAEVFLQFVRVVAPVVGATIYRYDQYSRSYNTILNWSLPKGLGFSDALPECAAAVGCHILAGDEGVDGMILQPCHDPIFATTARVLPSSCLPFSFSDRPGAGARLYFQSDSAPSPEQIRLLNEVTPMVASAFQRAELEYLVKKRDDDITVEQQRIARDVHDSLGQSLAYLRLRLDQISMEFNQTTSNMLRKEVVTLRDLAKDAYDQMRDILVALAPESNSNLKNALLLYIDTIKKRSSFKLDFRSRGQPPVLQPTIQRHIFFIFREALTNVEKHAHAQEVCVELNAQESGFEIVIHDDGIGFDPGLIIQNGHFGLKNMQARAMEINARLSISSQPGYGTHLVLYVPHRDEL